MILTKSLLTKTKLIIFTSIFLSVIYFTSSVSAIPQVAAMPMPETNSPTSERPDSTMSPSSNSKKNSKNSSNSPSATSPSIPIIPSTSEVNNSQSIDTATASNSSQAENATATVKPVPFENNNMSVQSSNGSNETDIQAENPTSPSPNKPTKSEKNKPVSFVNNNMSLPSSNGSNETDIQAENPTSPSPNKATNLLMSQNNNQTGLSCNGTCMLNNNKSVPSNNTSGSKSNVTEQSTMPSSTQPPQFAVTPLPVRVRKMPDGNENE